MSTGRMVLAIFLGVATIFLAAAVISSCGSSSGTSGTGSVALYVTDDIADYRQVSATINSVSVRHTVTGAACDVLTEPTTIDITDLSSVLQLLNIAECPAVDYDRIRIVFDKSVAVTDALGTSANCTFVSYLDDGMVQPKTLECGTDTCTLDINGAVNVFVNQYNKLALDFNLKKFDVDPDPLVSGKACSVTMSVSPLHAVGMSQKIDDDGTAYRRAVNGRIDDLNTADKTFTLVKNKKMSFAVDYSQISAQDQPGLDELLVFAVANSLKVKVLTASIDFATGTISASQILVKVEGTVSGLDTTNKTFTLTFKKGMTIPVNYSTARVKEEYGPLQDTAWVDVKLYGYDGAWYLARTVEVEQDEGHIDDDMDGPDYDQDGDSGSMS